MAWPIYVFREANTANATTAVQYGCLFPEMIKAWRAAFAAPEAFFGFIQLSTWYVGADGCAACWLGSVVVPTKK